MRGKKKIANKNQIDKKKTLAFFQHILNEVLLLSLCFQISAPDCMLAKLLKWSYLCATLEFMELKYSSYLKLDFIEILTK